LKGPDSIQATKEEVLAFTASAFPIEPWRRISSMHALERLKRS
jgi:hypothetical protein